MKGQVSQVFVYIITAIVIVSVLGFGVRAIFKLMSDVDDVACLKFKTDFEKRIQKNKAFGTVDEANIRVGCDYPIICFVSDKQNSKWTEYSGSPTFHPYPVIKNSWDDKARQNLFFVNQIAEEFHYVPDLVVENSIQCYPNSPSGIKLKFRGLGDATLLVAESS